METNHFYRKWDWIQWRCNRPTTRKYYLRWWKWIKCEWKSFQEFKNDMYDSYLEHVKIHWEKNTTLDRIDRNKNYWKSNCRWATYEIQNSNLPQNNMIEYNWEIKTLFAWCKKLWLPVSTIHKRYRNWCPIERLFSKEYHYRNQFWFGKKY